MSLIVWTPWIYVISLGYTKDGDSSEVMKKCIILIKIIHTVSLVIIYINPYGTKELEFLISLEIQTNITFRIVVLSGVRLTSNDCLMTWYRLLLNWIVCE